MESEASHLEKLTLVASAFVLYLIAFRVNQLMDTFVIYAQGIALVYLPAGIKHVAILIGRFWGGMGCFLALAYVTPEFWPEISFSEILHYSAISTFTTLGAILLGMRILAINSELSNLRFIHLPVLDVIATSVHSFVTNAYFIIDGMKMTDDYVGNALAMALGDFTGSFIMMMMLFTFLKFKQALEAKA